MSARFAASLPLTLRAMSGDDVDLLFEWRNRPEIVVRSTSGREVAHVEHASWCQRLLASPDNLPFIIVVGGKPAGHVRFVPDARRPTAWLVSIYLVQPYSGRGLGPRALEMACVEAFRRLPAERIVAEVLSDNTRSVAAFQRAGFSIVATDREGVTTLQLLRPDEARS